MTTEATEAPGTETTTAQQTTEAVTQQTEAQTSQTEQSSAAESLDQLPAWAQKLIRDTRKEAGDNRVAKQQAAEEARNEILQKLGLVKGEEKADPEALAKDLSAKDQTIRALTVERALDKAARKNGADEDLLAAVLNHQGALGKLDPSAEDFTEALDALVKSAVEANPKLKAARAAAASGIELTGGNGEQGQITEQQLKTMSPEQIVAARQKGLLRGLLG